MTLKKSMQKLYLKLVGEATDKNNIAKIISDLADNYSGGSGGESGSAPLVVNIEHETIEGEYGGIETLDKTWQEIYDAFPNVYILDVGTTIADEGSYTEKNNILQVFDDYETYGVLTSHKTFTCQARDAYPTSGGTDPK